MNGIDLARRTLLLEELINLRRPPSEIEEELASFGWDSRADLVLFTRKDARNLLMRLTDRDITEDYLRDWAEVVENREDIGFEAGYEGLLQDFVFNLANRDLVGHFDPDRWIMDFGFMQRSPS